MAEVAHSKWASRFIVAAVIQGGIAFGVIVALLFANFLEWPVSRAVAAGGIAMWLVVGFVGFLTVGVVATAVTALFYQHLEVHLGKPYTGFRSFLAWLHLILMNVGATVAGGMMMWVGFWGGIALQPESVGGWGWDAGMVHTNIAAPFVIPIGIFMALGALGVLLGGVGYLLSWYLKIRESASSQMATGSP